jgi:hypothetical protein
MPGIFGTRRVPRSDLVRIRRNWNRQSQIAASLVGNGLTLDGDGKLAILLDPDVDNILSLSADGLLLRSVDVDHGDVTGLLDDDHTQYLLADGTRALAGDWDLGGFDLTDGGDLEVDSLTSANAVTIDVNHDFDMQSNDILGVNAIVGDGSGNFLVQGRDGDGGGPPSAGQSLQLRGGAGTGGGADGVLYLLGPSGGTKVLVNDTTITINDAFFVLDNTDFDGNNLLDVNDIQVDSLSINKGAAIDVNTDFDMQDNDILDGGEVNVALLTGNQAGTSYIELGSNLDVNGKILIMDIDGDSYFYMIADDIFALRLGGFDAWRFSADEIKMGDDTGTTRHMNFVGSDCIVNDGGNITFTPGSGFVGLSDDGELIFNSADDVARLTLDKDGLWTLGGDLDCDSQDVLNAGNLMLSYAGISKVDNAAATAIAASGTPVQITVFDTNSPSENLTPDHTNDHITVDAAGDYLIMVSATIASSAAAATLMELTVQKNNGAAVVGGLKARRNLAGVAGGDHGSVCLSDIVTLAASDTIEVWIENVTDANDYTVRNISLTMRRLDYA